jgi:hypothetical protein
MTSGTTTRSGAEDAGPHLLGHLHPDSKWGFVSVRSKQVAVIDCQTKEIELLMPARPKRTQVIDVPISGPAG